MSHHKDLSQSAKEYVAIIEQIEKTRDPEKLEILEEKRVELHGKWMDMLTKNGIKFKNRDHATRIAIRIAQGEI